VDGLDQLLLLGAGLVAGIMASTVGVASIVSFPTLVALGLPPVTANVSNTLGLVPGGLSGAYGYREELREHPRLGWLVLSCCVVGASIGAVVLLALPPGVFEAVVPWLILFTCLLVGAQPKISEWLARRRGDDGTGEPRHHLAPVTIFFATVTGVYGGYFGAGAGVMMVAVLGLGTDLPFKVITGLRTLSLMVGNVVAGLIFIVAADPAWDAVVLLAAGSVVGGYVGARIGRRLPDRVFRSLVVVVGAAAAIAMM
jgi:uncharacterized membrane protein YfcA